ncbi:MAG: YggS family pyridoxal phosphate enzyme [Gemmatimonadetes bacterium RBG_16_66_8]|nr:MAG: YggS family pyridoxal phosphate enzyme [Gemmatimonadetes bacterium RBG_16_66_8]
MSVPALADNLARVREEIARVQAAEGLRQAVRIVAVTKGHSAETVRAAWAVGLHDVGENRVQEALDKQERLADVPAVWHLIGHLQTNKARFVPGRFACVHSVDSLKVAEALQRAVRARSPDEPLEVLVQVNASGEPQKSGCAPAEVADLAAALAATAEVRPIGLMTMAPFTDDQAIQHRVFATLRELRDRVQRAGFELPELSMGMSGDYRAAVAEGATMLRLGTVLFGERAP